MTCDTCKLKDKCLFFQSNIFEEGACTNYVEDTTSDFKSDKSVKG